MGKALLAIESTEENEAVERFLQQNEGKQLNLFNVCCRYKKTAFTLTNIDFPLMRCHLHQSKCTMSPRTAIL